MRIRTLAILVFFLLTFTLLTTPVSAYNFYGAINIDGDFSDWSSLPVLITDAEEPINPAWTVYQWTGSGWITGDPGVNETKRAIYERSLDLLALKIAHDGEYVYFYWEKRSDFLDYFYYRGSAMEGASFTRDMPAPAAFDHDMVIDIDLNKDGKFDNYLVLNVTYPQGAYYSGNNSLPGYTTKAYLYLDSGNGSYDGRGSENLIKSFGEKSWAVRPGNNPANGRVAQEVKADIIQIFNLLSIDWNDNLNVRYEAHSSPTDTTDTINYKFDKGRKIALSLYTPNRNLITRAKSITIRGKTAKRARVAVFNNGKKVGRTVADSKGRIEKKIGLKKGINQVLVRSYNSKGMNEKRRIIKRK